ncbi:SET domain-containing protein [Candidatus Woesearchaeota archaeon]|nr:SET domain-containing protein [Candidatus Woesearchaeota archaeon]
MNNVKIKQTNKGKGIFAAYELQKETKILKFERNFVTLPNTVTLRIDEHKHQLSTNPHSAENYINHACDPNAYIDFNDLSLRALRKIKLEEEITYNYFTSDWDNEDPFDCKCGSPCCKKLINGFKHLSLTEKKKLAPLLSPFLKKKLGEELTLL